MHQLGLACVHKHAQARALAPCRGVPAAVSQALAWPYRGLGRSCRSAHAHTPARHVARHAAPAPSARASALRATHLRPTPAPCRGLGCALYCDTMPCLASCPWSQYTRCIAIQHLQQPSSSIAIHLLPTKLYCNTILNPLHSIYYNTMQYPAIQFLSLLASLIAIQFPVLQYKFFFPALKSFSCNTNLCQKD